MLEEYILAIVVAIVTVMLVTVILLATLLDSLPRRYRASDVVGPMATTSVMTACIVSLCALFLAYGAVGGDPHSRGYDEVPALRQGSTDYAGSRGVVPSQTDADSSEAFPSGLSE